MNLTELEIPGVYAFDAPFLTDERGSFTKLFHTPTFVGKGVHLHVAEMFTSRSKRNVVRGLHFQRPPYAHDKLVTCLAGEVFDVVLDLRRDSATFNRAISVNLSAESGRTLIIPLGCAHGFVSRSEEAIMLYATSKEHVASADDGVLWSSIDLDWGVEAPILSARDLGFRPLDAFKSPF